MTATSDDGRGGFPFESVDTESQLAIRNLLEAMQVVDEVLANEGPLVLLQTLLLSMRGSIQAVLTCDAPPNTRIPRHDMRMSEEAAKEMASVIEIPDRVPDEWPED